MRMLRYDPGVEMSPLAPETVEKRLDAVEKRLAALEPKVPEAGAAEPVLCYVDKGRAWFTTQSLSKQWGDDWNDAPYEHNAGDPYSWSERLDGAEGRARWDLYTVLFVGEGLSEPCAFGSRSVEEINRGRVIPWVMGNGVALFAGTPMSEFLRVIRAAGGAVTEPVRQEPTR